jgi:hypothetical protein
MPLERHIGGLEFEYKARLRDNENTGMIGGSSAMSKKNVNVGKMYGTDFTDVPSFVNGWEVVA